LSGEGEHLWVRLRKTGQNTDYVARELARVADVPARNVGYAGRKDRHAVTSQWFSIQLPGKPDPDFTDMLEGVSILEMRRHSRKLQTGYLDGNGFELVLRQFEGDKALLEQRLEEIRERGVPNYFGAQRFGLNGNNLPRARAWFAGEQRVRDRSARSLLLSSARAYIFNKVLSERVGDGSWQCLECGDRAMLGTGKSHFLVEEVDASISERLDAQDIHPSGPMWGKGSPQTEGRIAELECAVAGANALLRDGLERMGLDAQRRALRVIPKKLCWEWIEPEALKLCFDLPAGCFATTVLNDMLEVSDALAGTGGES